MAFLLQGGNTSGVGHGGVDFFIGQQAHEFGAGGPQLLHQRQLFAQCIPDGIQIFDIIGILTGFQSRVPDAGTPFVASAELAFELLVPQQGGAELFGLFLGNMLGVVGDAGLTYVVRHGGKRTVGQLAVSSIMVGMTRDRLGILASSSTTPYPSCT